MNVAILLPNIGPNQLAFLAINQTWAAQQATDHEFFLFIREELPPCQQTRVSVMNISEYNGFHGVAIATDLQSCRTMLNAVNNTAKIFYIYDLEWIRQGKGDFFSNMEIYRNPNIKLIARSEDHAKAIENYCNRKPDMVIEHFNLTEIMNGQ